MHSQIWFGHVLYVIYLIHLFLSFFVCTCIGWGVKDIGILFHLKFYLLLVFISLILTMNYQLHYNLQLALGAQLKGHWGTLSYIFNRPFDLQTFIINLHHIIDKTFKIDTEICCDNRVFNSHITLGQNAGQRQICCNTKLHLETNQRKLMDIPSKYHIPFARSRIEFNNEHHNMQISH